MKSAREAFPVASDGQVKIAGGHLIQLRQVAIEHHFVPADQENPLLDHLDGDELPACLFLCRHGWAGL
jgi:hypothetical protein